MMLTELKVDLVRDQASILIQKLSKDFDPAKPQHVTISINLPIPTHEEAAEDLKELAIDAAKKALEQALLVLSQQDA